VVVGDEDPVAPGALFEGGLLGGIDGDALDHVAPEHRAVAQAVAELGDLADLLVNTGHPVGVVVGPDHLDQPGVEGHPAQVGDTGGLHLGEQRSAIEARVEPGPHRHPGRDPTQGLGEEGLHPRRGPRPSPTQSSVEGGAGGSVEAQQRVQGVAELVGAIDTLTPGRAAEQVRGVEVERHLPGAIQAGRPSLDHIEGLVQLTQMTEREPAQPAARRLGHRGREPPQLALGDVVTADRKIVDAPSTAGDGLGHPQCELGVGQTSGPALHRQALLDLLGDSKPPGGLPQQLGAAVGGQRVVVSTRTPTCEVASCAGRRDLRQATSSLPRRPSSRTRAAPSAPTEGSE
jgi:hypothetical protein